MSRRLNWAGHIAIWEKVFTGKPTKRPIARHSRRWQENVRTDLQ